MSRSTLQGPMGGQPLQYVMSPKKGQQVTARLENVGVSVARVVVELAAGRFWTGVLKVDSVPDCDSLRQRFQEGQLVDLWVLDDTLDHLRFGLQPPDVQSAS